MRVILNTWTSGNLRRVHSRLKELVANPFLTMVLSTSGWGCQRPPLVPEKKSTRGLWYVQTLVFRKRYLSLLVLIPFLYWAANVLGTLRFSLPVRSEVAFAYRDSNIDSSGKIGDLKIFNRRPVKIQARCWKQLRGVCRRKLPSTRDTFLIQHGSKSKLPEPSQECDITANSQWSHRKITVFEMCEITVVSKCNLTGTSQWYHSLRCNYEIYVRSQRSQSVTSPKHHSDVTIWEQSVRDMWDHCWLKV